MEQIIIQNFVLITLLVASINFIKSNPLKAVKEKMISQVGCVERRNSQQIG